MLTRDDRGAAMVTALMLIMVVGTLSILVLGTLVSQVRPAALTQKTTRTVFAAETGTQVALGELRTTLTTVNGDVYGDPSRLPCTLSGSVGTVTTGLTYSVAVQYFSADPSALTAAQRSTSATRMTCGVSGGERGVASAPAYAVISARGLAAGVPGLATAAGDRALESQYAFQRTNKNIPGGLFRTSDLSSCLEAGSATVGSEIEYTSACSARTATNSWVHDERGVIMLASTAQASSQLCLSGPQSSGNDLVRLAKCAATAKQLFSYKGYFRYEGQNDSNTGPGQRCLWAGGAYTNLSGRSLRVGSGGCPTSASTKTVKPYWSWNPEPAVGAGTASKSDSQQLINYAEFGRCLEVTQESLKALNMGIGPCKQSVPGNDNRWNQVWTRTEPESGSAVTTLQVTKPGTGTDEGPRCLVTPTTSSGSTYPTLVACSDTSTEQRWTRTTQTNDYSTSYLIVDAYNRCLGGGPTYTVDDSTLTSVVVEPCDGSLDQKWNAPPNTTPPGQSNTYEAS